MANKWDKKWFGFWKEYGTDYVECPSIHEFIGKSKVGTDELNLIVNYLNNSSEIASTSRENFPHPLSGLLCEGSISYVTDGVWIWLSDLSEYILECNVCLPDSFIEHIRKNEFIPVADWTGEYGSLELPPVM